MEHYGDRAYPEALTVTERATIVRTVASDRAGFLHDGRRQGDHHG